MNLTVGFKGRATQIVFIIALFTIAASATLAQAQTQPAPSPTRRAARPMPPPQYIPPHDYDQRNIKLELSFDWEQEQAIGVETITFAPVVKDLSRVDFDGAYMTVAGVKLASGAPLKFEYDASKQKLAVMLDHAYQPADEVSLVISYHTNRPTQGQAILGGNGLTFIKPRPDDPSRPRQIWTQGESETNHQWFFCFDHPNDFVTSEMVVTVAKPLSVVSNGKLLSVKDNPDGTRTFDWKIDDPHATYLSSIIVGEYVQVTGEEVSDECGAASTMSIARANVDSRVSRVSPAG